jgi:ferredoxin/flavodoxin
MTIFYFTSTGNCLAVAKRIGGESATLISIPQIIDQPTLEYKDDMIGVIFPIYGLGQPKMVQKFFEKIKWTCGYAFTIGTYGNLPGAAMFNTQKLTEKCGYKIDYAASLLMVDNYLPNFDVDDQIAKLPKKNPDVELDRIISDINAHRSLRSVAALGARAITAVIQSGGKPFMTGKQGQNYIVDEKCVTCGICAKVCPAANISVTDNVLFAEKCEGCLGCVHLCPNNAIHLKNERSDKRWRHPDVSLAEIIKSNDRTVPSITDES